MRFLFINQYYAPDIAATAQMLGDLCEGLAAEGHEVHVLTGRASYDGRASDLAAEETLRGVHVHRLGGAESNRKRYRDRLMGYLGFYTRAFSRVHFLPRPDVVVTLATPPLISLLGVWLRLTRRSRFVSWVMDVYPDIALRSGVLKSFGPTRAIWSALGRISYKCANRIVVLGHDMKEVIARKGTSSSRIEVVNCWSSEDVKPVPAHANTFRKQHDLEKWFTVMYSGNAGSCHEFAPLIRAIEEMDESTGVRYVFVGGGKKLPEIRQSLNGSSSRVLFLPYQERARLAESLSAGDLHIVSLDPRFDGLLVPSKIYGIMAAGRPVLFIGSEENEAARIVLKAGCGLVIPASDHEAFVSAVRKFAAEPEMGEEMGRRGREYFEDHFTRDAMIQRFGAVLDDVAAEPGLRGWKQPEHRCGVSAPATPRRVEALAESGARD